MRIKNCPSDIVLTFLHLVALLLLMLLSSRFCLAAILASYCIWISCFIVCFPHVFLTCNMCIKLIFCEENYRLHNCHCYRYFYRYFYRYCHCHGHYCYHYCYHDHIIILVTVIIIIIIIIVIIFSVTSTEWLSLCFHICCFVSWVSFYRFLLIIGARAYQQYYENIEWTNYQNNS